MQTLISLVDPLIRGGRYYKPLADIQQLVRLMAMSEWYLDAEVRLLYLSVPDPKTKPEERDVRASRAAIEEAGE